MKNRQTYKEFVNESILGVMKSIKSGIEKMKKAKEWKDRTTDAMSNTEDPEKKKLYKLRLKFIEDKLKMLKSKEILNKQKKSMQK